MGFLVSIDDDFGTELVLRDQDYDDHGYFDNYCDEDEKERMRMRTRMRTKMRTKMRTGMRTRMRMMKSTHPTVPEPA